MIVIVNKDELENIDLGGLCLLLKEISSQNKIETVQMDSDLLIQDKFQLEDSESN
jgi:hypothetical protein